MKTADTVSTRCHYYRATCGLPVTIEPVSGRISFRAGMIWGVMVPVDIALPARGILEERQEGGDPIISHPRSCTWMFLTRSDIPVRSTSGLIRHNIQILSQGAEIALPSPVNDLRHWVSVPTDRHRPSGTDVINAIRATLGLAPVPVRDGD